MKIAKIELVGVNISEQVALANCKIAQFAKALLNMQA
jgi:hypothetical protein